MVVENTGDVRLQITEVMGPINCRLPQALSPGQTLTCNVSVLATLAAACHMCTVQCGVWVLPWQDARYSFILFGLWAGNLRVSPWFDPMTSMCPVCCRALGLFVQVTLQVVPDNFDAPYLSWEVGAKALPLGSADVLQQSSWMQLSLHQQPYITVDLAAVNSSVVTAQGVWLLLHAHTCTPVLMDSGCFHSYHARPRWPCVTYLSGLTKGLAVLTAGTIVQMVAHVVNR